MCGRVAETGVAVEAASRPQPHEYLARAPFESPLQFDGVVARLKDKQRYGPHFPEPPQQSPDLLAVASAFASRSGRRRFTSTGAVQLSRTKPQAVR